MSETILVKSSEATLVVKIKSILQLTTHPSDCPSKLDCVSAVNIVGNVYAIARKGKIYTFPTETYRLVIGNE